LICVLPNFKSYQTATTSPSYIIPDKAESDSKTTTPIVDADHHILESESSTAAESPLNMEDIQCQINELSNLLANERSLREQAEARTREAEARSREAKNRIAAMLAQQSQMPSAAPAPAAAAVHLQAEQTTTPKGP
jgi:hypothetical protein